MDGYGRQLRKHMIFFLHMMFHLVSSDHQTRISGTVNSAGRLRFHGKTLSAYICPLSIAWYILVLVIFPLTTFLWVGTHVTGYTSDLLYIFQIGHGLIEEHSVW